MINDINKKIYVSKFNRKRPEHNIESEKRYYTTNVNQNNIVPVLVDLDANDSRLYNIVAKESNILRKIYIKKKVIY